MKYFPKDIFRVASLIGGIFDLENFEKVDEYVKSFLTLLMSEYETNEVKSSIEKFTLFATTNMWPDDTIQNDDSNDENFQEFDAIYKSSKFFQHYETFIQSFKEESSKSRKKNLFFNPKFAALFNKKYIAFLPLWSSMLTSLRTFLPSRANNGDVEGDNNFKI